MKILAKHIGLSIPETTSNQNPTLLVAFWLRIIKLCVLT